MALITIIIVYVGTNILLGIDILNEKTIYYAYYNDINGLKVSNSVMLNGYKIGQIQSIGFTDETADKLKVEILINEKVKIPKNSKAVIVSKDVLGTMVVDIQLGDSHEFAKNGDALISEVDKGLMGGIDEYKGKIASMINSVDSIALSLKDVLHHGGSQNIGNILTNLDNSSKGLNEIINGNKNKINSTFTTLNGFANDLNKKKNKINTTIDNISDLSDTLSQIQFKRFMSELQQTVNNLNQTIASIEQAEGSVGKLIKEDSLYTDLQGSIANLNLLISDIKANPKRYINITIFGAKNKEKRKNNQ